jgi:hypothetical protein
MSENLIFWRLAAGGYKLLAHGLRRDPHPQDLAVISQPAYTYYFAQAITSPKLLAIRIKQLAHRIQKTDPHPLFNSPAAIRHFIMWNAPGTKKGTPLARVVYFS